MNERLLTLAEAQLGAFGADDAARVGVSSTQITTLVRRKVVQRIRRGAYVLTSRYAVADLDTRRRLRVMAVLRSRPEDRASHHSALAVLGISTFGVDEDRVEVESRSTARRRCRGDLVVNPWSGGDTWAWEVFRSVPPALACVQVAATGGRTAGVCAMDSALRLGRCSRDELLHLASELPTAYRSSVVGAIDSTDDRAESVGESRTRLVLTDAGFLVESQVEIFDAGTFVGRVDLLVDGCVIVEFDGLMKYDGIDGRAALAAEKAREEHLIRLGYEVVRIVWADLADPLAIVARVRAARAVARERRAAMSRVRG
ncbi:MAG: hypothetical protein GXY39_12980 [Actinomycetales bacterium]|nr:hypothetical protein [Actinomycetales bacterium]